MKNYFFILVFLSGLMPSLNAQDSESFLNYRRSSLGMMTILHPKDSFYTEIKYAVESMPFPDKYNEHNTPILYVPGSDKSDRKVDLTEPIANYLKEVDYAKHVIARWYNFDRKKGGFNMDLVAQRGLWDASEMDLKNAMQTTRGKAILADAGEDLIQNTFLIVNDFSYINHAERAAIVKEYADITQSVANETAKFGNSLGGSLGNILSLVGNVTSLTAGLVSNGIDILNISGFVVRINTYLYQIDWDEETQNLFYENYYTSEGDSKRIQAFWNDTENFKMKFVGKYEQFTDQASFYSSKTPNVQILGTCARTLEKNISNLQKKHDVFKVRTPIYAEAVTEDGKVKGFYAQIGMKEGVTPKSVYTVLERCQDKEGRTFYKKVGTLKPDKKLIWDNRYVAGESNAVQAKSKNENGKPMNDVKATLFKKSGGGKIAKGMLIVEGKYKTK